MGKLFINEMSELKVLIFFPSFRYHLEEIFWQIFFKKSDSKFAKNKLHMGVIIST